MEDRKNVEKVTLMVGDEEVTREQAGDKLAACIAGDRGLCGILLRDAERYKTELRKEGVL